MDDSVLTVRRLGTLAQVLEYPKGGAAVDGTCGVSDSFEKRVGST